MKVDVLLGLQWGDEGKGKIVDVLTPKYDIIARFQGGPNAGHTIEIKGNKHVLHTIPSGIFHPEKSIIIGNGVIIDPLLFQEEIHLLRKKGVTPEKNLVISKKPTLSFPPTGCWMLLTKLPKEMQNRLHTQRHRADLYR